MTAHPITSAQPPIAICGGRGTVQAIPLGSDNVGWIVACEATGDAALVDGPEAGPYLEALAARNLRLAALWTTHTHGDHIGLHRDLQRRGLLQGLEVVACRPRAAEVPGANVLVDDGDVLTLGQGAIGQLRADVWRLEGHLRDHIGFVLQASTTEVGAVFCGDTMFGAGRGTTAPASWMIGTVWMCWSTRRGSVRRWLRRWRASRELRGRGEGSLCPIHEKA